MTDMKSAPCVDVKAAKAQTAYEPASKTYTVKCAICGRTYTYKKKWYRKAENDTPEMTLYFNYCRICGRWVCEDCYWMYEGDDFCRECGEKRGVKGYTATEYAERDKQKGESP